MAKKIKFPLEMKDGVMVRTLEELQENFDAERLVAHLVSGKLQTWLSDRHYESMLEKIESIDITKKSAINELCEVLGLSANEFVLNVTVNEMEKRWEKTKKIRQYTDDKNILSNINEVALSQKELDELLTGECKTIFLIQGDYHINFNNCNEITFVGLGTVKFIVESKESIDFEDKKICFVDIEFDGKFSDIMAKKKNHVKYETSKLFYGKVTSNEIGNIIKVLETIKRGIIDIKCPVANINNDDECKAFLKRINECYSHPPNLRLKSLNPIEIIFPREHKNNLVDWLIWRSFYGDERHCNGFDPDAIDIFGAGQIRRTISTLVNCGALDKAGADEFILGCNNHNSTAEWDANNPKYLFLLYLLLIISIDDQEFNNSVNVVSEFVYYLNFSDEVLKDFIMAVREIIEGDNTMIYSKCNSMGGRNFFKKG